MANRRLAPLSEQPESFAFTPENAEWAKGQIAKYPEGRQASAVIPLLWKAQEQNGGWLPRAAIEAVADQLGMPHIRVLEVATFYTMFALEPVGRYWIQVCGTAPCDVCGARELKQYLHERLGPRAMSARTATSPGSRSSAWARAATPRWRRSTTTTTRISPLNPSAS